MWCYVCNIWVIKLLKLLLKVRFWWSIRRFGVGDFCWSCKVFRECIGVY